MLININFINRLGSSLIESLGSQYYHDVNDDGFLTPIDVLLAVNYLNSRTDALSAIGSPDGHRGEGEFGSDSSSHNVTQAKSHYSKFQSFPAGAYPHDFSDWERREPTESTYLHHPSRLQTHLGSVTHRRDQDLHSQAGYLQKLAAAVELPSESQVQLEVVDEVFEESEICTSARSQ